MALHTLPMSGAGDDAEPTCHLYYIRRRLGREDYGDGRLVTYVSKLIEKAGFPKPLPHMSTRKVELIEHVTNNSRWLRPAVDQWFDDFLPPEAVAAMDAAAMSAAASDMDEAAKTLGSLRVVGGRDHD